MKDFGLKRRRKLLKRFGNLYHFLKLKNTSNFPFFPSTKRLDKLTLLPNANSCARGTVQPNKQKHGAEEGNCRAKEEWVAPAQKP